MTDLASSDGPGQPVSTPGAPKKGNSRRWWLPWLLVVIAIAYYSTYALSGLDLGGEGGTTAVIAQRLLEGQRPFIDTFLGYNLLWFYPLVWLFQAFGPNFTVVRIFFFILSIVTALLAYRTVRRVSGSLVLAFICALVLILIPGIQFRNYLGLLGVGNLTALLEAFALPHRSSNHRLIWIIVAAFAIALTFLIRIELGFFFCGVALASVVAYLLLGGDTSQRRLSNALVTIIALPVSFLVVHLPISYYAEQHGFAAAFWEDYLSYWQFIEEKAESVAGLEPLKSSHPIQLSPRTQPVADASPAPPVADRSTRRLPNWTQMFTEKFGKKRILVFLLYYPILGGGILGVAALWSALSGLRRNRANEKSEALVLIIGLASTFTLFPQYFFFRPVPQHLSEMMCPFLVVSACSFGMALRRWKSPQTWLRWSTRLWLLFLLVQLWFYLDYGLAVPWMGSIGRKKPNEQLFRADNGVLAYLPKDQKPEYEGLYQAVTQNSAQSDWVICYPYAPTVNFMTNRRSYLYNLYVDNATRPPTFDDEAIAAIEQKKPAVILINDDPINATESSRFSVWATATLEYIKSHYRYVGTYVRNAVYVAPSE
ncbi:MAG: hypothetical protein JOZ31_15695 [Verrucomicrobia bacterium]|nr:hypothetical protein [Verrucomicrobiota bacterium]